MTTSTDSAPQVGERWIAGVKRDALTEEREVTITKLHEVYAEIEGGENSGALLPGHHLEGNWCLLRRAPSPARCYGTQPKELPKTLPGAEFKVGDRVEGYGVGGGPNALRGTIVSFDEVAGCGKRGVLVDSGLVLQRSTLRKLPTPDQSGGKAETKPCCRCGATVTRASDAADPGEMPTCRPCKAGVNKPARKPKTDPYATGYPEVEIAAMQSAIDAKREKRKALTLDDFDRPLKFEPPIRRIPDRSRGATICTRHLATPKRVKGGHPPSWPSVEGEDDV